MKLLKFRFDILSPKLKKYCFSLHFMTHGAIVHQDGKNIIFTAIDENDTETFSTFGTQPTTEISQTTTMTPTLKDKQTYLRAPQGAN